MSVGKLLLQGALLSSIFVSSDSRSLQGLLEIPSKVCFPLLNDYASMAQYGYYLLLILEKFNELFITAMSQVLGLVDYMQNKSWCCLCPCA